MHLVVKAEFTMCDEKIKFLVVQFVALLLEALVNILLQSILHFLTLKKPSVDHMAVISALHVYNVS